MIISKKELKSVLKIESQLYHETGVKAMFSDGLTKYHLRENYKYIKALRKCEYYYNNKEKSLFCKFKYYLSERKKNKIGFRLGIEVCKNSFEQGLLIQHANGIVVNGESKIGKNCILHGGNCIGNNGKNNETPIIGDNVDVGFGAIIIGKVKIADNIKIGAGAVVVDSFIEKGITIAGVPARKVK